MAESSSPSSSVDTPTNSQSFITPPEIPPPTVNPSSKSNMVSGPTILRAIGIQGTTVWFNLDFHKLKTHLNELSAMEAPVWSIV